MGVKVKICGITDDVALDAAIEAAADYIGLVFYPPSPRNIDLQSAHRLAEKARGCVKTVALMVDPDDDVFTAVIEIVNPDLVQLHGDESPDRLADLKTSCGKSLIKAIHVAQAGDAEKADKFDGLADLILFDAKPVSGTAGMLPGGNGLTFDWSLLSGINKQRDFLLSGGLNADNVGTAIALTKAPILDVSSGVEHTKGRKDPKLIRAFIKAAKAIS